MSVCWFVAKYGALMCRNESVYVVTGIVKFHICREMEHQPGGCATIVHTEDYIFEFLNALRTGDADLRFYITTVQDG